MSASEVNYSAVASFERSKLPEDKIGSSHVFAVILLAVFFIVMMAGLAAGVSAYRTVASNQVNTNDARMQAGLLVSNIHANDRADTVETARGPEGPALVLVEKADDGSAYELRFYQYRGQVVQEYALADAEYKPERAQQLFATKTFDFELNGNLLVIRTDLGTTNVALRSYQGGAA